MSFVTGALFVIIFTGYNNLWNDLTDAFCMVSNQAYYDKILQHKVSIEEYTKGKTTEYKEREINKLTYQTSMIANKKALIPKDF